MRLLGILSLKGSFIVEWKNELSPFGLSAVYVKTLPKFKWIIFVKFRMVHNINILDSSEEKAHNSPSNTAMHDPDDYFLSTACVLLSDKYIWSTDEISRVLKIFFLTNFSLYLFR